MYDLLAKEDRLAPSLGHASAAPLRAKAGLGTLRRFGAAAVRLLGALAIAAAVAGVAASAAILAIRALQARDVCAASRRPLAEHGVQVWMRNPAVHHSGVEAPGRLRTRSTA